MATTMRTSILNEYGSSGWTGSGTNQQIGNNFHIRETFNVGGIQDLGTITGLGKYGADGIFGSATRKAVERFQDNQGFPLTGQWGEEEQAALLQRLALQAGSSQTTELSDRLRALAQELLALADSI